MSTEVHARDNGHSPTGTNVISGGRLRPRRIGVRPPLAAGQRPAGVAVIALEPEDQPCWDVTGEDLVECLVGLLQTPALGDDPGPPSIE